MAIWGGDASAIKGAFADPRLAALGERPIAADPKAPSSDAATPADYHHHRIAHGVGDAARDLEPDRTFPLAVTFEEMTGARFPKGCFIGQSTHISDNRRISKK